MFSAAIFTFSAALSVFLSQYLLPSSWQAAAGAVCVLLALSGFFFKDRVRAALFLAFFGLAFGFLWNRGYTALFYEPYGELCGEPATYEAVVIGYPVQYEYSTGIEVRAKTDGTLPVKARIYVYDDSLDDLVPGDTVRAEGKCSYATTLHGAKTDIYTSKGVFLFIRAGGGVRPAAAGKYRAAFLPVMLSERIRNMISVLFPPDTRAFMTALLTGDKDLIYEDAELESAMSRAGVYHMVCVSGMHIAILVTLMSSIVGFNSVSVCYMIPLLVFFAGVTGFSPTVVRAVIMQSIVMASGFLFKDTDRLTSLGIALFVLLLVNPFSARNAGLQLSFASVLGMTLFSPRMYAYLEKHFVETVPKVDRKRRRWRSFLFSNLTSTAGALILTLPIIALYFGYISVLSPVANLLVLWALPYAFALGLIAVAVGFIWLPAGTAAAYVSAAFAKYIILVTRAISKIYAATVYLNSLPLVLWFLLTYAMLWVFIGARVPMRKMLLSGCVSITSLAVILVAVSLRSDSTGFKAAVLDVGQGQCIALTSGEYTAVIDCGSSSGEDAGELASEYLHSMGRKSVDMLILTHYHADHANGVGKLMANMRVSSLAAPPADRTEGAEDEKIVALAEKKETDIIYVVDDMQVQMGDVTLYLYAPLSARSENERCVCILIRQGDFEMLVTGDSDMGCERRLISEKTLPDIEALVVGHHGSRYATCDELLDALRPEVAAISVGYNSYGHPTQEVLERLEQHDIEVYRTDIEGNVTIYPEETVNGKDKK